jgi:hypothetical protein
MTGVGMKGTFRTSSAPMTHAARSRVVSRAKIGRSMGAATRGIMTYTTPTTTSPLNVIHL